MTNCEPGFECTIGGSCRNALKQRYDFLTLSAGDISGVVDRLWRKEALCQLLNLGLVDPGERNGLTLDNGGSFRAFNVAETSDDGADHYHGDSQNVRTVHAAVYTSFPFSTYNQARSAVKSTVSQKFGQAAFNRCAMSRRIESAAAVSMRESAGTSTWISTNRARPTFAT